jgi:hypothetical protein
VLCCLERAAAGKDREAGEELLLVRIEQGVAPVDRRTQRLLPRSEIARPSPQQLQPALEPAEQLLGREQPAPGCGELEGERQTVETSANRRQHGFVACEIGPDRAGALSEQRECLLQRQRLEWVLVLAGQV